MKHNHYHYQKLLFSSSSSSPSSSCTNNNCSYSRFFAPFAERACDFLSSSPDPFHAVANSVSKLRDAGFQPLSAPGSSSSRSSGNSSKDKMNHSSSSTGMIQPGGKYYYTIHDHHRYHPTAFVAFTVGRQYKNNNNNDNNNNAGYFHILGGHTDSPTIRIKPHSKSDNNQKKSGCVQLNVSCYGGGLWHTWFDRDLGISGKVLVRNKNNNNNNNNNNNSTFSHELINLCYPIARISTLCPHLSTAEERKSFSVNTEDHLNPIVATTTTTTTIDNNDDDNNNSTENILKNSIQETLDPWLHNQEPLLLTAIANHLRIDVDQIADFALYLYDTQKAALGGIMLGEEQQQQFLYSARLDNLATVFCSLEALIHHGQDHNLQNDSNIAMIVHMDHEEVGSDSSRGAGSPMIMEQAIRYISSALRNNNINGSNTGNNNNNNDNDDDEYNTIIRQKSFFLSFDMAHAIHPNYAMRHESSHAPQLNNGVVIKRNTNQRYATDWETGFLLRELVRRTNNNNNNGNNANDSSNQKEEKGNWNNNNNHKIRIPIQEFMVRNDSPCGSTIGPKINTTTGIRVADVGMPQLSQHSIREVMGIADLTYGYEFMKSFFRDFHKVDYDLKK